MHTLRTSAAALAVLASFLLVGPAHLSAEDKEAAPENTIVVRVSKVRNGNGQVGCSLFSKPDAFPNDSNSADGSLWTNIKSGKALCTFENVKPGTYAISVLHDEDKNGKMNTKSFGRPAEGWGVSNNAPAERFGPPKYDAAKFKYEGGTKSLSIDLIYP